MFWTDWGEEPKIERGCMDGSCREKIVTDRLKWINGLTIDFVLQRLYWVDAWEDELSSCKYDGSDRQIILQFSNFLKHPFTMTTFEDWVYWIDWSLKSINKADKFSGQSGSTTVANKTKMTGTQLFHPYRQPDGVNHCQYGNNTCLYLCLPTAHINSSTPKVSCVVPDEISTVSDDQIGSQSVCSGTNKRMLVPENRQQHYKFLLENYSNCTYVQGNLEITWLQDENMDLSFLQHIREVTGYVLISHVNIYRVVLPKLQIIRGQTRFKLSVRDEEFALFISLSKMHSLELPELRDILNGSVGDVNNYNLCHSETILWDEIISGDDGKVVQIYNFNTPKRECVPCDDSCDKGCWNIGPENCQKFSKLNCNSQCSKLRCYGEHEVECCHHLCAGGCYGPRLHDCLACRYFSNNGECTETCPPLQRYNHITHSWERNPNGKYLYGSSCVTKCPDNYLSDNGTCVQNCPSGKEVMNGECVPCNGPCKRTCQSEVIVHSGNIDQFQNCTTIEGSITIVDATFSGFQLVYHNFTFGPRYKHMHPSKLEVFSSVNKITGYIHVEAKHPDFKDLSYFRNLKFIEGQELTDFFASLYIANSSLETLGLSSLEKIGSNISIMENRDLCFVSEINWNNLVSPNVKPIVNRNKDTNICIAENMVCDMECSEDGCWGPGPKQCLTCAHSKLGNHCLHNCSMIPRFYMGWMWCYKVSPPPP